MLPNRCDVLYGYLRKKTLIQNLGHTSRTYVLAQQLHEKLLAFEEAPANLHNHENAPPGKPCLHRKTSCTARQAMSALIQARIAYADEHG